jgi:protein-tyrosine phosphatase
MKILFVCMSNICRSPALEAVLRAEAARRHLPITVDSCGVGWFHLGDPPDARMAEAARKRSIIFDHSAQEFQERFFDEFDLILAVDQDILEQLKLQATSPERLDKLRLATAFSKKFHGQEIPDPYYLGATGFDYVMDMAEDIAAGILERRSCAGE